MYEKGKNRSIIIIYIKYVIDYPDWWERKSSVDCACWSVEKNVDPVVNKLMELLSLSLGVNQLEGGIVMLHSMEES